MRHLFLIGMPGVGKTYWGKLWATHYGIPFLDLDAEILRQYGNTSAAIILQQGEARFREAEAAALRTVISIIPEGIISTGGGTPVFLNNMDWMRANGPVLWLHAASGYLAKNISRSNIARPLLEGEDIMAMLENTFRQRQSFYEKAHLRYDAEALTIDTFAAIREACINLRL